MPTKTITVGIKALDDGSAGDGGTGRFTAYASVFGNVDAYGEVVDKGAFARTLEEWGSKDAPIPLYWSHMVSSSPLMNLGHVVSAEEDDVGLLIDGQLDIEGNTQAAYVHTLMKAKRVNQMSFAYDVLDYEEADDAIHLRELKLHEVSVVPIGANSETEVLDVKGGPGVDPLRHLIDSVNYNVKRFKAGRTLSAKNEGKIRDAIKALNDVLADLGEPDEEGDGKSNAPKPLPNLVSAKAAIERMGLTYAHAH